MVSKPDQRPTPDAWKAGDLKWIIAPDEVTPAVTAELEEHLARQRAEARVASLRQAVVRERQTRKGQKAQRGRKAKS